jgi:FkbM family methyltransferase
MSLSLRLARKIRHLPALERSDRLWNALRPGYLRLLNARGRGIAVSIGGSATIRLPAEFVAMDWQNCEPDTVRAAAQWVRNHPGGLFLDIGSYIGVFSAVALFSGHDIEVVAFDSDLASLASTYRFCAYAPGRLRAVYGFVTEAGQGLALEATELTGPPSVSGPASFTNLSDGNPGIPENALDDLFGNYPPVGRPILIKGDIEGAELLMLRGAKTFIARHRPSILLSVHPMILPHFGHTADAVREQLVDWGYDVRVLAIDYEEHWWCSPGPVQGR